LPCLSVQVAWHPWLNREKPSPGLGDIFPPSPLSPNFTLRTDLSWPGAQGPADRLMIQVVGEEPQAEGASPQYAHVNTAPCLWCVIV
jgi:hypothetical protein